MFTRLSFVLFLSFLQFNFILANKLCCDVNDMCHDGVDCVTDDMYILSEDTSYVCEDNNKLCKSCGDNILDIFAFESCDDGNTFNGDGCDKHCEKECGIISTYDKVNCGNNDVRYFISDVSFTLDCGKCISSPYDSQTYIKYVCNYDKSYISVFEDENCNNLISIYQSEIKYTNIEINDKKDVIERKKCSDINKYIDTDIEIFENMMTDIRCLILNTDTNILSIVDDNSDSMVYFDSNLLYDENVVYFDSNLLYDDNIIYFDSNLLYDDNVDNNIKIKENNDITKSSSKCLYGVGYWFSEMYIDNFCSFPSEALKTNNNVMLKEIDDIFKLSLDKSEFRKLKVNYFVLILNKYNGYNFDDSVLQLISKFENNYNNDPSDIQCSNSLCESLCSLYNIDECNYLNLFQYILSPDFNKHCFANPKDIATELSPIINELKYENECIKGGNDIINLVDMSDINILCGINKNTQWVTVYEDMYSYQIPQICCKNCEINNMLNSGVISFNNDQSKLNHENNECFSLTSFATDSNCEGNSIVNPIEGVFGVTCIPIENELGIKPFSDGTIIFYEDIICNVESNSLNSNYPICITGFGDSEFDINIKEISCSSDENNTETDVALIVGISVSVVIILGIFFIKYDF